MASNGLRGHKFEVSISAFGIVLGTGILITDNLGTTVPTFSPYDLGASAVPNIVAILIIVLSVVLFTQAWRADPEPVHATGPSEAQGEVGARGAGVGEVRRLVLLALLFAVYVVAFWTIGFIVSTIAFLLVFYRILGSTRWLKNVLIAVFFTAAVYYLFRHIFSVPIPARLLEILVG